MKTSLRNTKARQSLRWPTLCILLTVISTTYTAAAEAKTALPFEFEISSQPEPTAARQPSSDEGAASPGTAEALREPHEFLPEEPEQTLPRTRDRALDVLEWDGIFWEQPQQLIDFLHVA